MRNVVFSLFLVLAPLPALAQVLHHDAEIRLDPVARQINVVDTLTAEGGAVRITVPEAGRRILEGRETLRYSLTLPPFEPGAGGAMAGEEGAYLPVGGGWLAGTDAPESYSLTVSVPPPYVAIATGSLSDEQRGETYRARFTSLRPGEGPSLFVGRYIIHERMQDGLRLRAYFSDGLPAVLAQDYLDLSGAMIRRFSTAIGPYPYDAFHIIAAPLPVGLGFPGLTYISSRILPLPFIRGQSLPHEIVHNWWGNGVEPAYDSGNWAEGLTTFMADYRLADAEDQTRMRLDWLRDYAALPAERDTAITAFRVKEHGASQVVGYNKTAFVFVMLQDLLGEPDFAAGLQRFWRAHKFTSASWTDLRHAFEQASGRDLSGFFTQWLAQPGAPVLRLDKVERRPAEGGWTVRLEVSQDSTAYALDIPLLIETAAGSHRDTLHLDGTAAGWSVTLPARPITVAVDPDHRLFRRLLPGEAPPILREVTIAQTPAVVIAADGAMAEAAQTLAGRLIETGGRNLSPEQAAAAPGPVLLIGGGAPLTAALTLLRPQRPAPQGGSARVWAAERPGGGTLMVVAAEDAAALSALLRPLPHYGRYGWLVFDGGTLARKGQWPLQVSPLTRTLETVAR